MEDQNTPATPVTQGPEQTPPQATPPQAPPSPPSGETQPTVPPQTAAPGVQPGTTPPPNVPAVSMEEKLFGMLSYIILVALFTLLLKPKSDFVRLHGRQGLVMTIGFFLSFFLVILPFIGAPLTTFIVLAIFVVNIFSMYQSLMGNWWKIPIIGDIAEQIPMSLFEKASKEAVGTLTGTTPPSAEENQPTEDQTPEGTPPSASAPPPVQPN